MSSDYQQSKVAALPCWTERLRLSHPRAQPEWGQPGILCLGATPVEGLPGLLLVRDEQARNSGASATNALPCVLEHVLGRQPALGAGLRLNVVEQDSDGFFDHVHVTWHGSTVSCVQWSPVKWGSAPLRSVQAFEGLFGVQATRIMNQLKVENGV